MNKQKLDEENEIDFAVAKLIDGLADNPAIFSDILNAIDLASRGNYLSAALSASSVRHLPIITLGTRYARIGQDKLLTDMLENGLLVKLKQTPLDKANKICQTIIDHLCSNGDIDQTKVFSLLDQMTPKDPQRPEERVRLTKTAATVALFTRDELLVYFELAVNLAKHIDNAYLQRLGNALTLSMKAKIPEEKLAAEKALSLHAAQLLQDLKTPIQIMMNDPRMLNLMKTSEAFKQLFILAPTEIKSLIPMVDIAASLDLCKDLPLDASIFKDKDLQKSLMDIYLAKFTPAQRQVVHRDIELMHKVLKETKIGNNLLQTGNELLRHAEEIKAVLLSYAQYEQDDDITNVITKSLDFARGINLNELIILHDKDTLEQAIARYFDVDYAERELKEAQDIFNQIVSTPELKTKFGKLFKSEQNIPEEFFVGDYTNQVVLVAYEKQEKFKKEFAEITAAKKLVLENLDIFTGLINHPEFNAIYDGMIVDLKKLVADHPTEINNLFKILQRKDPELRADLFVQNSLNLLAEMKFTAAELIMKNHGDKLVDLSVDKVIKALQDPEVCQAINSDLDNNKGKIIPKIDFALRAFDKNGQLAKFGIDGEFALEVLKRVNDPSGMAAIDRFRKAPGPINAIRVLISTGNLGFVVNHLFSSYMGYKNATKKVISQERKAISAEEVLDKSVAFKKSQELKAISIDLQRSELVAVTVKPVAATVMGGKSKEKVSTTKALKQEGKKVIKAAEGMMGAGVTRLRNLLPGKKIPTRSDR